MIWPGRRRARPPAGRSGRAPRVERVGLGDVHPDPAALLGQTAYLQLSMFETASAIAGRASELADREALTGVAAAILSKHQRLVELIVASGADSADAMQPFTIDIERYRRRLGDAGWYESVLTLHLASGLLDDFFARLATGAGPIGGQVAAIVDGEIGHEAMADILRRAIVTDARLTSRLALWGRRIVGDTLLVARSAVERAREQGGGAASAEDVRIEPVLTDLIAAHSRRMDDLGLTA